MLWIMFSGLAVLAAVCMALPLRFRAQAVSDRNQGSVAILADQLREVEADAERGLISAGDARAAQIEIKRRLLALRRMGAPAGMRQSGRNGRWILWVAAIAVPLAAVALYTPGGCWRACKTILMAARPKAGCCWGKPTCAWAAMPMRPRQWAT
jgi:cytochrome c-type biogenesis protein CcmH